MKQVKLPHFSLTLKILALFVIICLALLLLLILSRLKNASEDKIKTGILRNPDALFDSNIKVQFDELGNSIIKFDVAMYAKGDEKKKICISAVYTEVTEYDRYDGSISMSEIYAKGVPGAVTTVCTIRTNSGENSGISVYSEHGVNFEKYRRLYPYDVVNILLAARFWGYSEDMISKSQQKLDNIPVNVSWEIVIPNRKLSYSITTRTSSGALQGVQVNIARLDTYTILTPILSLLAIIFIFLLPLVRDIGSFSQASLAIIFGLWGIRQLLIPDNKGGTSLLDTIFLGMYLCILISVPFWIYLRYRESKDKLVSIDQDTQIENLASPDNMTHQEDKNISLVQQSHRSRQKQRRASQKK